MSLEASRAQCSPASTTEIQHQSARVVLISLSQCLIETQYVGESFQIPINRKLFCVTVAERFCGHALVRILQQELIGSDVNSWRVC